MNIRGATTARDRQRWYWRGEMESAHKAMELYPVGSDEREIYRAKYNEAAKRYNELFEEVCYRNGRKVNT